MVQTVTIEKLVSGGYGLARTDKGVIFVTGVAPGEIVTVEPCGKKGGSTIARPLEIVTPSPSRRSPPCPLSGICGGCDWLHLTYDAQLATKRDIVLDCVTRIGRIADFPEPEVVSAGEFSYRHRAQIKISAQGKAGFFARNTNDVVSVAHCPLLVDPLNLLLADIAATPDTLPHTDGNIMVFAGDNEAVASSPVIVGKTADSVALTVDNKRFEVQANDFFQSNRPLLERFGSWARPFVHGDFFVDLYGGSGFFSLMLAGRFKQGLLIESVAGQVGQARENFQRNGYLQLSAVQGAAERLAGLTSGKRIDCLIVDPPRPGLSEKARESIAAVGPAELLYVSCNPSTQARDLGFLVNRGYAVERAVLFDLYPNTHHIESMVLLCKGRRNLG